MCQAVILSAVRTAIGKFGGALKDVNPAQLGAIVIKEAVKRINIQPCLADEVIMGNVIQAGQGQNPARQASIKAELPVEVPAYTVNMVCGSGLNAVSMAADKIKSGNGQIIIAGGMENMSMAPFSMSSARWGKKMGNDTFEDLLLKDGLIDAFNNYHMGITAENVAEKYGVSREEQDKFAEQSQRRAAFAISQGKFVDEIVPVNIKGTRGEEIVFNVDEFPRADTTYKALSKLHPCFKEGGTVTAGNSSGINDGAAALVISSMEKAKELSVEPMAVIRGIASTGVDPKFMGIGPISAIKKVLKITGLELDDIDLIELNEAFASQSIAVIKSLGLDTEKVNVNGGAIALGHPIGCSGSRILVTLLYEMKKRNSRYGLASLCVGGGMGVAAVVEMIR